MDLSLGHTRDVDQGIARVIKGRFSQLNTRIMEQMNVEGAFECKDAHLNYACV